MCILYYIDFLIKKKLCLENSTYKHSKVNFKKKNNDTCFLVREK